MGEGAEANSKRVQRHQPGWVLRFGAGTAFPEYTAVKLPKL